MREKRHCRGNMDIAPNGPRPRRGDDPLYLRRAMPCSPLPAQHAALHSKPHGLLVSSSVSRAHAIRWELMEVGSLQHLGDSFSYRWLKHAAQAPSFKRLVDDDVGGSSRYFIDMDPADLFSMRWTAPDTDFDFDFDLPGGDDDAASPIPLLVSASQIFHDGRLLPHELDDDGRFGAQEDGDAARVAHLLSEPRLSASSPLFHSAQSTPASLSSSSSARSGASKNASAPPLLAAGRRGGGSSPWKILLRYLRFLMPLYRKVRALPPLRAPRTRVSPASPASARARASTSSIDWCHGIADTAVHDAILYCKKSSVSAPKPSNTIKQASMHIHTDVD